MFKKVPTYPKRLKNGDWSVAQGQNTTAELFVEALRADADEMYPGENQLVESKEYLDTLIARYANYIMFLKEEKAEKYFKRIEVQKTPQALESNLKLIKRTAYDMLNDPLFYPAPNPIKCNRCAFKDPCRVRMGGGDPSSYLQEGFRKRRPYEKVEPRGRAS